MQDGPSGGQDQPRGVEPASPPPAGPGGVADPLAAEAAELRRLVDAGAGSPEELRALAARLRQHRQREEARWRAEVKPQLRQQGKGRLRRQPAPPPPLSSSPPLASPVEPSPVGPSPVGPAGSAPTPGHEGPDPTVGAGEAGSAPQVLGGPAALPPSEPSPGWRALWVGLGLLALTGMAILAASTTVWVLVLPVVALLAWAWSQGRDAST